VAAYLGTVEGRLRPKTLSTYRQAVEPFVAWAERQGVTTTGELTRAHLTTFRDYLTRKPKKTAKRGARRGERNEAASKRAPVSVNRELRALKTMLSAWRTAGQLGKLDRDAIEDTLKALPVTHEQAEYLTPAKIGTSTP
jgi:uncharacterized membrane protein YebE (DUF533 family)